MRSQERRPSWALVIAFAFVFAAVVGAALLAGCARQPRACTHLRYYGGVAVYDEVGNAAGIGQVTGWSTVDEEAVYVRLGKDTTITVKCRKLRAL